MKKDLRHRRSFRLIFFEDIIGNPIQPGSDSQISFSDFLAVEEIPAFPFHDDLSIFHDVGPVGKFQGLTDVLLYQQDGGSFLADILD